MKRIAIAILVAFVSAAGARSLKRSADTWPIDEKDQRELAGLRSRYRALDEEIAAVASGDRERARAIGLACFKFAEIDRDDRAFARDLHARLGVPDDVSLVVSGSTWTKGR